MPNMLREYAGILGDLFLGCKSFELGFEPLQGYVDVGTRLDGVDGNSKNLRGRCREIFTPAKALLSEGLEPLDKQMESGDAQGVGTSWNDDMVATEYGAFWCMEETGRVVEKDIVVILRYGLELFVEVGVKRFLPGVRQIVFEIHQVEAGRNEV